MATATTSKAPSTTTTDLERLRAAIRGTVITPEDSSYDDARTVWNAMIDRRPRLIVRCAGTADVITAVTYARRHDLVLSIRGGGHNVAGNAVCDDGLMIDLSGLRSAFVDPSCAGPWSSRARPGPTSITRPRPTASRCPAASSR